MKTPSIRQKNKIAAALQPFVDNHSLAGAVTLVATKDKILDVTTVGFADVARRTPMRRDGMFWIASMTKPMTGAAVMMLVDEGRLSVDDPVEKYLPEFKDQMVIAERDDQHMLLKRPAHPITLRNVLTHTSGLPFNSRVESPSADGLPLRTAVLSYAMLPLQQEPDTKYVYSNAGINIAARILEVVTGQPYEKFLAQRLLKPLGMTETTFWPNATLLKRLAKSYKPNAAKTGFEETGIAQLQTPYSNRRRYPLPAGGLFSTARDVARFGQMVLNAGVWAGRRYLSEAAVREMTRRQTAPELSEGYGFGWQAGEGQSGHGGALATNVTVHWRAGLVTVFLVQHTGSWDDATKCRQAFEQAALRLTD